MLARAGELGSKRVGEAGLGQQHSHLLDVFIEDFCSQVKSALRGGAIARYSERTENLNAIRGRLELTEHLARTPSTVLIYSVASPSAASTTPTIKRSRRSFGSF